MAEKKSDESGTDRRMERGLLIARLRKSIGSRRNRIRSLGDIIKLDPDLMDEKTGKPGTDLFESSKTIDRQFNLESQISEIRKRIKQRYSERAGGVDQKVIEKLREDLRELQMKERLKYVITRVSEEGRQKLFDSEKFAALFSERSECSAVVVSMDIRRSTGLMLAAESPEIYAEFITSLTEKLSDCITDNYGIFEKFTGDGVLAFYPDFYSGEDAFIHAVKSADLCHKTFVEHFEQYREYFSLGLSDTGLGIGIDCGEISLATINGDLSIVGTPVVYACRYSSAPAGKTYLTQNASCAAGTCGDTVIGLKPVPVNIKHEGESCAYEIVSDAKKLAAGKPDWDRLAEKYSAR